MKHATHSVLLGIAVLLAACNGSKTEQPPAAQPGTQTGAQVSCYSLKEGQDLTAVQLKQDGNAVVRLLRLGTLRKRRRTWHVQRCQH